MNLVFQAAVLGLIQGLTEFLPISSTAHLIVIPYCLGWEEFGQTFDVALHAGTLVALFIYFRRELMTLLTGVGDDLVQRVGRGRFLGLLFISAIPGGIAGALWEHKIDMWSDPDKSGAVVFVVIGSGLLVAGVILYLADVMGRKERGEEAFGWACLYMGVAQALALIPGVSRSGITMTAGLFGGLRREVAARTTFLISIPIISGAVVFKLSKVILHHEKLVEVARVTNSQAMQMLGVALIVAAVSGYLVIAALVRYLNHGSFKVFVVYRVAVGAALIWYGMRHLHG